MQDPSTLGKKLGWYGITVLAGLFVHGLVLLPLFYFVLTKKNPFSYIRGLLQAMVIALATSSRSEFGAALGWGGRGRARSAMGFDVGAVSPQFGHAAHHYEVSAGELPR